MSGHGTGFAETEALLDVADAIEQAGTEGVPEFSDVRRRLAEIGETELRRLSIVAAALSQLAWEEVEQQIARHLGNGQPS